MFGIGKKPLALLLAACVAIFGLAGCSGDLKDGGETSAFTKNIDRYWREHNIDGILDEQMLSAEHNAEIRAEMLAMYGENREITDEYDEDLAAETASGVYVGKADADNIVSWKGVPYAKQPVGELRWKAPQKPDASDRVFEARYFGKTSVQLEGGDEPSSLYPQGEDCLNLNVWNNRSDESDDKPIMVWIHGGAYVQGGTSDPCYDGTNFVKSHPDVIFASVGYRTDFLGFINFDGVPGAEDYADTANLGLLDQIQALSWLKENARAFGGDPERITIFGESAGAGSVSALTLSPKAKGLFSRGIMQSGTAAAYLRTASKSKERTRRVMEISGTETVGDLMSLTASDIRKIETILLVENAVDYPYPQCDGIVLPMDIKGALASDARDGIDIMVGTTKDEYAYWTMLHGKEGNTQIMRGLIEQARAEMNETQKGTLDAFMASQPGGEYDRMLQFINYRSFHCPARHEAKTHAANGEDAYVYYFTEETNNPDYLSCHGYDLGFVLGNIDEKMVKDLQKAKKLSAVMQRMWVNFAKTGNPSLSAEDVDGVAAIQWDKYDATTASVMVFNAQNTGQKTDPVKEGCDQLMDLFLMRIKSE